MYFVRNSGRGKRFRDRTILCVLLFDIAASANALASSIPQSQSFGSVNVGTSSSTVTLSYTLSGLSGAPSFSPSYGLEFTATAPSCTGSGTVTCTVGVKFSPLYPGLRQDALIVKDNSGNFLGETYLNGTGSGPQMVLSPGIISTIAGVAGTFGYAGDGHAATAATLAAPYGVAVDPGGNVYIADSVNQVVRKITASNGDISTVAGNGGWGYSGDGGPALSAQLANPAAVALDAAGNLYIADQQNNVIREVNLTTGNISTVAGGGNGQGGTDAYGDGGPATAAILNNPNDIALDAAGNIYIADMWNGLVREVSATTGLITIVAGGGPGGGSDGLGDGGLATEATLSYPASVALDASGNVYVADSGNCLVREINSNFGMIIAVAGSGNCGNSGDLGPAISAELKNPAGVRVDAAGNLYIADYAANVIREVIAASGIINTIAGTGSNGDRGDNGSATNAAISTPSGIALDTAGNVYLADPTNNVIRKVTVDSGALAFTTVNIGQASNPQLVTVSNIGTQTLSLSALSVGTNFRQQTSGYTDCSSTSAISSGANCFVAVAFVPTASGGLTGTLTVTGNSLNDSGTSDTATLTGTGANGAVPKVTISPSSLSFGNQTVSLTSAAKTLTLSNTGTATLNLASIALTGVNSLDFGLSTTCASTLGANASCTVTVTFTPGATGARSASLTFTDSVASSPQSVPLAGTGVLSSPTATINPSSLSFGNATEGVVSAAEPVTLANTGTASLTGLSISITGTNSADFAFTTTCGSTLAANANCTASVTFKPGATGARSASLVFTDSAANSPQSIPLSGTGVQPASPLATFSSSSLSFGNQNVGVTSAAQSVTLSNTGTASLTNLSISVTGTNSTDFAFTTTCGSAVAANANCAVNVTFKPGATGARSASLVFTDSAANSPQSIPLSGTGVQPASPLATFSSSTLSFGNQNVGVASAAQSVTLSNTGTASLTISSISLTGANPSDFGLSSSCASTLAVNASCIVALTFTPGTTGARSASLMFTDTAAGSPQSVGLSGTGVQPQSAPAVASLSPPSLAFGTENVGASSAPLTITLSNTGGTALGLSGIALGGTNATDFSLSSTCGATIAPAANCSVSVTFTPLASGARSASLTFSDTASNSPQTIPISGTGATSIVTPPTPSFTQVPGALTQISVGADGTVWGLNSGGQIFEYNSGSGWTMIPGGLSRVIVGSASAVWGLNASQEIFSRNVAASSWTYIPGALAQLVVGCDGDVWGLNASQSIYHYNATNQSWQQVPGTLAQLAVGSDGAVWGINGANAVFRFNNATQNFSEVPGTLTQIAVGADGDVWGLDNQAIFHFNQLTQSFTAMAGALKQLAVGSGGNVYGLNSSNQVCQYNAQSQSCTWINPALTQIAAGANGVAWGLDTWSNIWTLNATQSSGVFHQLPGAMSQLAVAADGSAWALDGAGAIFAFNAAVQQWTQIPGALAQIAIAPQGIVWGLNGAGQIFCFNPSNQSWTMIAGTLAQIEVGGNGAVWGLNSSGQIFTFNSSSQSWTSVPGALAQISVGADGTVWGINSAGQAYLYEASSKGWHATSGTFSQIAVGSSANVWALGPQGQIYRFNSQANAWSTIPGALSRIAVSSDGAVWGVNSAHQIWQFNSQANSWTQVYGSLVQIKVASDAVIWGLDPNGIPYRFQ